MKKVVFAILFLSFIVSAFAQQTSSFKDTRDGKTYKTVKIGDQWWMAENLAYKASSGCWAYDNNVSNVTTYGYLYDWETAKNSCPSGWHLPETSEWNTMLNFLGGAEIAGWYLYKIESYGNNLSGFNAVPGGGYFYGNFVYIEEEINYWTGSLNKGNSGGAHLYSIVPSEKKVYTNLAGDLTNGFSVRCIKD